MTAGTRLGPYEVTAQIGKGGMGEVYLARDTRLKRDVALKLLPESVSRDPDRLARFQREAEILASMNHPNIAAIHGLEESDGVLALVLELVDGPTLADRIAQGPLPLDEALPIARQIAEALEAAHERGIVHRDLKPANIKVRPDGTVKVLDFGLAKALDPLPASGDLSQSPTITTPARTMQGVILGTAAYMSPEQARGKVVDKRTDIWAFGCVLYEMLSGRRAFHAAEVADTIAAILTTDVDLSHLPAGTPPRLRQALTACLQRDPRRRFHDVGDLRLLIDGAFESAAAPHAIDGAQEGSRRIRQRVLVATATLVAIVGWALAGRMLWMSQRVESHRPVRLTMPLRPDEDLDVVSDNPQLALSPDGRALVYAARRSGTSQLYRRPLDQLSAVPIPGTEGAALPFFSPDGAWIAFSAGGTIKKVSAAGGDPITITRAPNPAWATWAANDTIVFSGLTAGSTLRRVSAAGGDAEAITTLNTARSDLGHASPDALPDGVVLFGAAGAQGTKIVARSLVNGQEKELLDGQTPTYVQTGHLVFIRGTSLWAVPFDARKLEVTGPAVRLVEGVLGSPAIGRDGTLAYVSGVRARSELVWVDRRGHEEPLSSVEPADFIDLAISPDGQRIAVSRGSYTTFSVDVWIADLGRQSMNRLITDPGINAWPMWTPDGRGLVYSSTRESQGGRDIFRRPADGTGPVERLTKSLDQQSPWSWSRDGKTLVLQRIRPSGGRFLISTVSHDGGDVSVLIQEPGTQAAVSPDGRWIAYNSDQSGSNEVWVRPFPNVNDARWQISTAGGSQPKWAPNGRELFYRRGSSVMRVSIDTEPRFQAGRPERLFDGNYQIASAAVKGWDLAPDGRFLMKKALRAEYSVNVVLNWSEELKQRVPTR